MSKALSRRALITAGLTAGAAGLTAAARIAERYGLIPPDWGGVWGPGETLTYACQRFLVSPGSMAREFPSSKISSVTPVSGRPPKEGVYPKLLSGRFADWRLNIEGLVATPMSFSLAELQRLPATSQITEQTCEEGWSFVAEWTGVRLSEILKLAGASPRAKYVVVFPLDDAWDSIDMQDAWHPQTLVAYAMNGKDLTPDHGAPVRLKVPRQLGYKSVKFLSRIRVTDTVKNIGKGLGSVQPEGGYSWYAGI
jgi:DMSO/TMAO reductase YedYZ molybdopterin-dependent catalytic subunit